MEVIKTTIASSKGNLTAAIHYSETKTERLAILCPGYLDSKDYKHLVGLAEKLNKQGYAVVRFDPTGTWESEGHIADYTTTQYLEDIKTVLEYMLKQAGYKHVLLGGHSRGGQVSILYAARDPRISLVLGIMPSTRSSVARMQHHEEWEKDGVSISHRDVAGDTDEEKEFRVPYSHAQDRDLYDVVEDAKKIRVPVILVAGELDDLVLPADVKEIFDNANEPKKFITIPGIGHNYRHNDEEISVVDKIMLEQLYRE